jgi:hypothetical protein
MDVISQVVQSAPWLVILCSLGLVCVSLLNCAIAEAVARIAAWLYSADPERRTRRREEWLAQLADMDPSERPAQAGSMLWVGLKRLPGRALETQPLRRPWAVPAAATTLTSRQDLLGITPIEFEQLVRRLFEAIGMDSWVTRMSWDDGIDAVATNSDPIMGGHCIVQAKRYTRAVGVDALRALVEVMADRDATKGILVTTSWVTQQGRAFAERNGCIQIIEGDDLVVLCRQHLGDASARRTTWWRRMRRQNRDRG